MSELENKRGFVGFFISIDLINDQSLNWTDRILFCEIEALEKGSGCYASNKYFSDFLNITERAVQKSLAKLKQQGYIITDSFNGRYRTLSIVKNARTKVHVRHEQKFMSDMNKRSLTPYIDIVDKNINITRESQIKDIATFLPQDLNLTLDEKKLRMNLIREELFKDNNILESLARRIRCDIAKAKLLTTEFCDDIWAKEDIYKSFVDIRRHLVNWANARYNKQV